jgi:hypothetical protein
VQPPPAATFDDLGPVEPVRPRRRASAARAKVAEPAREAGARRAALVRRAWAWSASNARRGARGLASAARRLPSLGPRLAPPARATLERLRRGARPMLSRLASDLPERPDGRTIAAAIAALVVVFGVSASVLGSRSNPRLAVAAEARLAPAPEAPALANAEPAAAPEAAPAPEAATAPAPAPEAAPARAESPKPRHVAKPHRSKRHAVRAAALHAHAPSRAR